MTTRMTVQRLGRLIAAGDVDAVRTAVQSSPALLTRTVERDGQGGWTPLHVAVAEGQPDVVRVLVEAGADLTAHTEFNRTPLHVALQLHPELMPVLRELGAQVDAPSAAYLGDVDQLTRHLDEGADPGSRTSGADLLSWAAFGGAETTAKLLLQRGADANTGALHFAAGGARLDLVRLLLDAGADVNRRDPTTGRTPLHAAVAAGSAGDAPEIVKVLLETGADVNATTHDGASALDMSHVAAALHRRNDAGQATGHDALADLLVAHGAKE
ncbi:ankyrin repeat domain-containing protein [Blastococcus sp. CT_GayMR16]|uniref:ankyrin repeat domain-containing protein n=1 Tax=Blastococcus sp. CT_GayMR16 TaxID=2559607 RepID=UPI001073BF0F|nr:ankyrin repeat domain-containing protein [Blastococcus sp. CT_GayMR16]TFV89178.1 ankyrin repeat domain-containing protein [Blastococcus sp. CT_GayMR16]